MMKLTFDFGFWSPESGFVRMREVLEAAIWILEERLRSAAGKSARLQEGFLLLLVLVDQLGDERGPIVVTTGVPAVTNQCLISSTCNKVVRLVGRLICGGLLRDI